LQALAANASRASGKQLARREIWVIGIMMRLFLEGAVRSAPPYCTRRRR
jgi:hypothetical protein